MTFSLGFALFSLAVSIIALFVNIRAYRKIQASVKQIEQMRARVAAEMPNPDWRSIK